MPPIITNVDQKALRTTKFPPEFNQKVDTSKINVDIIKSWAAAELANILGFDDDVVTGLLFDLLESGKNPDIKSLQLQLGGFLGKDAPEFCKTLWNLCLSAQDGPSGVPQQLLEAKKAELIQERQAKEEAAERARHIRDQQNARDRDLDGIRHRERSDRDNRRRRPDDRDSGRRSAPRRDLSPSPTRRSGPSDHDNGRRSFLRGTDSYVPSTSSRYDRRRSPAPAYRRRRSRSRSRSNSRDRSDDEDSRPGDKRRRRYSSPRRRRSPSPRSRRDRSTSSDSESSSRRHRSYKHRRRNYSSSRSPPRRRRDGRDSGRRPRRRSPSSSPERLSRPADKHRNRNRRRSRSFSDASRSPPRRRSRSRSRSEHRRRRRSNSESSDSSRSTAKHHRTLQASDSPNSKPAEASDKQPENGHSTNDALEVRKSP
ncbi:hypothetical protein ANO11243_006110 [Dothideomycetidae sp. 11243]|nr:hypothetical protein ANO11243_006110 [fungal sp. No.11243]